MSTLYNRLNSSRNRTRRRCVPGMPLSGGARFKSEPPAAAAVAASNHAGAAETTETAAHQRAAISRWLTALDAVFASLRTAG